MYTANRQHSRDANTARLQLKKRRPEDKERFIELGLMNPDRAIAIQDRVPIQGTCEDMCPEYERVRRQAQNDVSSPEFVGIRSTCASDNLRG
jgi:hypothetical protein